jgi:hypothetical protein
LTELTNDGSLCGQLATCAACQGLFQMPPLAPVPAVEEAGGSAFEEAPEPESDTSRRRKRAGSNRGFTFFAIVALVILPLLTLVVGISLIASGTFRGKEPKRDAPGPTHPRKKAGR